VGKGECPGQDPPTRRFEGGEERRTRGEVFCPPRWNWASGVEKGALEEKGEEKKELDLTKR